MSSDGARKKGKVNKGGARQRRVMMTLTDRKAAATKLDGNKFLEKKKGEKKKTLVKKKVRVMVDFG